jgi:hypothetical protein
MILNLKFIRSTEKQNDKVKMTITKRLHFLVVNSIENVEIVVQSSINQRIASQNSAKMAVGTAEIIITFRNIQVMALPTLIVVDQNIQRAIALN